jgi:hypothetical protein
MQILFHIYIYNPKQESVFVMGTRKMLPLVAEKRNSKNAKQHNFGNDFMFFPGTCKTTQHPPWF